MATDRQVLDFLDSQTDWVSSKVLAQKLGISVRTVNNLVKSANQEGPLILSSSKGYLLDREQYAKSGYGNTASPHPEDRISGLMKHLVYSTAPLDIYELADSFYISESTLKNDLKKIKERFDSFRLSLTFKKDTILCKGSESDKRRFIRSLLIQESSDRFTNYQLIKLSFPEFDIPAVKEMTEEAIRRHHMFINDYSLINIVLHLCICMKRVREGFLLSGPARVVKASPPEPCCSIASELAESLGSYFGLTFHQEEQDEWALLIENYSTEFAYNGENPLFNHPSESNLNRIADEIISRLGSSYFVSVEDTTFKPRFTLHLHNMLLRSSNNMYARNNLTETLKSDYPLLYDMSVFIANVFLELTGFHLNDDEIAYITLHLGSSLDMMENGQEKLKAALLCPSYYDLGYLLLNKLNAVFHHQMVITAVISNDLKITSLGEIDLLIVSYPISLADIPYICISPLFGPPDIEKLQNRVGMIQKQKKSLSLQKKLHTLFHPELFFYDAAFEDEWDAIRVMSSRMEKLGVVDSGYQEEVKKRERLSSTAFGCYAMPHSMEMTAIHSSIAVAVSPKPVLWNQKKVNIVFMIALNKEERQFYKDIYSALTELMADDKKMLKITTVSSYEELIAQLLNAFG